MPESEVNMNKYKVREYYRNGANKGSIKRELFFDRLEEAKAYYDSVFVYDDFSLNPTVWEYDENSKQYIRLFGY